MVLDTDMFSITIDESQPDNLWVATCGWVYNSINGGDKWTRYRDGFNNRRIHDVEIDPCDPDVVYAGSVAGLYRSEDRGKSWYVMSDEGLVINTIVLHPQRPDRIILGIEGDGVYVSEDRGRSFARTSDGLHNVRITALAPDPFEKNRVYGAVDVRRRRLRHLSLGRRRQDVEEDEPGVAAGSVVPRNRDRSRR